MTFQVITNGDAALAQRIADDMAQTAWRRREALLTSTKVHTIPEGVALAKQAVTAGRDAGGAGRSQRPLGLRHLAAAEIIAQDLSTP